MSDPTIADDPQAAVLPPDPDDDRTVAYRERIRAGRGADALESVLRRSQARQANTRGPDADDDGRGFFGRAGAVLSDVGAGLVEAPGQIAGGVIDATNQTITMADEARVWFERNMQALGGALGTSGNTSAEDQAAFREAMQEAGIKLPDQEDRLTPVGDVLPTTGGPDSVTGGVVRGISQFVTGFIGAGKLLKAAGVAKATTRGGRIAQAAGKGAVADFAVFDPSEARLSNLIERVPALRNPVTDFLAADEDDSRLVGRLKNTVEGLGAGIAADGFLTALRGLRNARRVRSKARAEGAPVPPPEPGLNRRDFIILGDPDAPLVAKVRKGGGEPKGLAKARKLATAKGQTELPVPEDVAARGLTRSGEAGGDEIFINFGRIDTPEDVQSVIGQMADAFAPAINKARRGAKRTFETVKLEAEQIDAWDTLAARRKGAPLNDAQTVAARNLWAASARKLTDVAREAAKNPSEANLFAFRKMLATHHAIQMEVIAARTETARALNAWKIPAGGDAENLRQVTALLEQGGGNQAARELAARVQHLDPAKFAKELDEVTRGSVFARSRDAILSAWVNGLLSGPKTHLVNMMSNTAVIFHAMGERAAGARLSRLLGTEDGVEMGEAMAQLFGMANGLRDGLRNAWKTARTGESGFGLGKVDLPRPNAIGSDAFGLRTESWLGKAADAVGTVITLPGRALQAEDEFFKTVGYRMELHAQALRMASREARAGKIGAGDVKARAADIVADPPENIRITAADAAVYQTFTRSSKLGRTVRQFTSQHPTLRFILPFVNTPINLFSYTLERTPLAPLMQEFRGAMAKGGADADLALTKMATGSAVMLATADLALSGQISGGGPTDWRKRQTMERAGWQPYSIKVGDRWFSYRRLDPLGSLLGISADMVDILVNSDTADVSDDDIMEAWSATVAAIAANTMSKTWMTGPAEFFEVLSDPKRYGEGFFTRFAGSFVPAAVGEVTRTVDPNMRAAASVVDGIKRRVPILSEGLPVVRDLWGRPRQYQSGIGTVYDVLSPVYSRIEDPESVDAELLRLDADISMPSRAFQLAGANVNLRNRPDVYSRFVELAGNGVKHPAWGMGAKDFLNAVIEGRHPLSSVYRIESDGPDGGKAEFIKQWVTSYREMAKKQLLKEFPDIRERVEAARIERIRNTGPGDLTLEDLGQ